MGGEKERERERETEGAVRVSSSQPGRKSCHYEFSSLELLPGKERERERKREKEREREREREREGESRCFVALTGCPNHCKTGGYKSKYDRNRIRRTYTLFKNPFLMDMGFITEDSLHQFSPSIRNQNQFQIYFPSLLFCRRVRCELALRSL
jgi:hypothetical protein